MSEQTDGRVISGRSCDGVAITKYHWKTLSSTLRYLAAVMCLTSYGCTGTALVIVPTDLPAGIEGTAYTAALDVETSSTASWTITEGTLPPGLELDTDSGVVSGVPTVAGAFDFTVTVQVSAPLVTPGRTSFTIAIIERLQIAGELETAREAEFYSETFDVVGGITPYQFELIGLPAGLTLDETTGTVSGTPLSPNTGVLYEVTVTDSGEPQQTDTLRATLVVKPLAVTITSASLADGTTGVSYEDRLIATDGTPPYAWAVIAGVLPNGLRLNTTTGFVTGIPVQAQTETFSIEVTDSDEPPVTDSREFSIDINP